MTCEFYTKNKIILGMTNNNWAILKKISQKIYINISYQEYLNFSKKKKNTKRISTNNEHK